MAQYDITTGGEFLDAIAGMESSDVFTLVDDISIDKEVNIIKDCKIHLKGHTLTIVDSVFRVSKGAKVSISGGNICCESEGYVAVSSNNTELRLESHLTISTFKPISIQGGKVIIDGSTIYGKHELDPTIFVSGSNSFLDVLSGKILSDNIAILCKAAGHVFISGGEIQGHNCAVVVKGKNSVLIVTGDSPSISSAEHSAIIVGDRGCGTIEYGTVYSQQGYVLEVYGPDSELRIVGGNFSSDSNSCINMLVQKEGQHNSLEIVGGTFTAPNILTVGDVGNYYADITGGTFFGELDTRFLPEGYIIDESGHLVPYVEPDPEPEPEPEPGPDPTPDPEPVILPYKSIVTRKVIFIQTALNNSYLGFEHIGALDVFEDTREFRGIIFNKVRTKRRGHGGYIFGYVPYDILETISKEA